MGKDSPAKLQYPLNENETEDDEKFQIQNNPSNKECDCQPIIDLCKDNSHTVNKEDKNHKKSPDEWKKSHKGRCIQRNNQQYYSDETKQSPQDVNEEKTPSDLLHDATCHSLDNRELDSDDDYKDELVKHKHCCNSTYKDYWAPEHTEKTSNEIDVRDFQKQDYTREFTKYINSLLDKCSWYENSEQEMIDKTTSLNEDDDTTAEELSTYDISSEDVNKSYDSDCSGIGIVQTSEGSVNEENKDGPTDGECNGEADEDHGDDVSLVYIDEPQLQFADDPVMDIVAENNWANQQAELENEQPMDDVIIEIVEITCDEGGTDDEFSSTHSADSVSPKSELVKPPFYYTPGVGTPVDETAKHIVLNNNGYTAAEDTEGTMQVILNMDVQISPPQDNINPMLPVQPRSLDDPHALHLPSSGGHLDIQGMDYDSDNGSDSSDQVEDVSSHEQSSSAGCLNIQLMDCTNGSDSSDSVEQAEDQDELLCNSLVSPIVEPPSHMMEDTLVHSFSSSSEGILDISNITETESENSEEISDCWLLSTSKSINDQEERLEFT